MVGEDEGGTFGRKGPGGISPPLGVDVFGPQPEGAAIQCQALLLATTEVASLKRVTNCDDCRQSFWPVFQAAQSLLRIPEEIGTDFNRAQPLFLEASEDTRTIGSREFRPDDPHHAPEVHFHAKISLKLPSPEVIYYRNAVSGLAASFGQHPSERRTIGFPGVDVWSVNHTEKKAKKRFAVVVQEYRPACFEKPVLHGTDMQVADSKDRLSKSAMGIVSRRDG